MPTRLKRKPLCERILRPRLTGVQVSMLIDAAEFLLAGDTSGFSPCDVEALTDASKVLKEARDLA